MKKTIKKELELIQITDSSKMDVADDEDITETRKVVFKSDGGTWVLTHTAPKDESEFAPLDKVKDKGAKAYLTLKLGENPQKNLQEFEKE